MTLPCSNFLLQVREGAVSAHDSATAGLDKLALGVGRMVGGITSVLDRALGAGHRAESRDDGGETATQARGEETAESGERGCDAVLVGVGSDPYSHRAV